MFRKVTLCYINLAKQHVVTNKKLWHFSSHDRLLDGANLTCMSRACPYVCPEALDIHVRVALSQQPLDQSYLSMLAATGSKSSRLTALLEETILKISAGGHTKL